MKLYGFPPTRSARVLWTLRELDVEFEFVNVDPGKGDLQRPEFLAVNPARKLPALVDGDFALTESVAICLYLAEKYPEKGLLPSGLRARAEVYRWLLFTATALEQPLWRMTRHALLYPPEKRLAAEIPIARQDFVEMAAVTRRRTADCRQSYRTSTPRRTAPPVRKGRVIVSHQFFVTTGAPKVGSRARRLEKRVFPCHTAFHASQ
ncbi:MAG TPA: glutathione S-transferase family protein [Polyangiaceae bacterium]|jgi:glutathione S-transferase|nr:glutathione S-transferase family protein [Polyangiaceae bacterium]